MTKKCLYEGCNKEIEIWKTYCDTHYNMVMQQQGVETAEIPEIPVSKIKMPKEVVEETVIEPFSEQQKDEYLQQKDRIFLRQKLLESAITLISQTDIENKKYEVLIQEIKTLVEEFYKIITQ